MLVWALIFAFFAFMTVSNLASFVADFQSHPVTTSINVTKRSQVEFPAVTICNLNRSNANLKLSIQAAQVSILISRIHCLNTMKVYFNLREKMNLPLTLYSGNDREFNRTRRKKRAVERLFYDYTGCNTQVSIMLC